jgi:hypothetical protein
MLGHLGQHLLNLQDYSIQNTGNIDFNLGGAYFQSCDPVREGAYCCVNIRSALENQLKEGFVSLSIESEPAELVCVALRGVC